MMMMMTLTVIKLRSLSDSQSSRLNFGASRLLNS